MLTNSMTLVIPMLFIIAFCANMFFAIWSGWQNANNLVAMAFTALLLINFWVHQICFAIQAGAIINVKVALPPDGRADVRTEAQGLRDKGEAGAG